MKIVLNLQFLTCKKYSEHRSTVKNCNFSKLQFFKCTSTVIPLHIFAVWCRVGAVKTNLFEAGRIFKFNLLGFFLTSAAVAQNCKPGQRNKI